MKANRKKLALYIAGIAAGIALVIAGILLTGRAAKEITGVCFGAGAGLFGMFLSYLVNMLVEARNPEAARVRNISENDERNAAIRDKAGARANRLLTALLPLATLIFVLMNAGLAVTLIMCGLIILQAAATVYYSYYFSKRM